MQKSEEAKSLSPYAGRWVARVHGKIVAQGQTAEQASLYARQSRPKEVPEIVFIPNPKMTFDLPLFSSILDSLPSNHVIYLVGGAVRDILLHRETHDLDFVVPMDGIKTARRVSKALNGAFFPLDVEKDVGRVIITNADNSRDVLDFSSYRSESIETDLHARDFSINALALDLRSHQFVDPVGGLVDLKGKRIRTCSETSIVEDPVRILRAVRFAAGLGFNIQRETRQLLKNSVNLLPQISTERLRDELFKILDGPKPSSAIRALDTLGVLPYILPEILELKGVTQPTPHIHGVWRHTLKAMDYLESIFSVLVIDYDSDETNDLMTELLTIRLGRYRGQFQQHFTFPSGTERTPRSLLFFSTLYHDVAKPRKQEIENGRISFRGHDEEGGLLAIKRAIKLRLSNAEMDRVKNIIRNHMRIIYHINHLEQEGKLPTRRAIYRFFRDTGDSGVDLCLLALADQRATYDNEITQEAWTACLDVVRLFLENWWEKRDETIAPPQLVNGYDLIASLGLNPGPDVGRILEDIREAQAMGTINSREGALTLAKEWLYNHPVSKKTKTS
jgi:tRNA nucleotidyltransferase/poly(A) polymerase